MLTEFYMSHVVLFTYALCANGLGRMRWYLTLKMDGVC